jgi:hypothetical protein
MIVGERGFAAAHVNSGGLGSASRSFDERQRSFEVALVAADGVGRLRLVNLLPMRLCIHECQTAPVRR